MKFKKVFIALVAAVPCLLALQISQPAQAAIPVNYHNLISDAIFDNYNSMTAGQIDAFLNGFPNSCISSNHGFRSQDPAGYNPTQGFLYGSNVTAGRVFADAAKAYHINPKVLLSTTQKEESLVTGAGGCSTFGYATAMGYGCPDSSTAHNYTGVNLYTLNGHTVTSVTGTCVNNKLKVGFTRQVIHAAWLLKFDRERAEGNTTWAIISGAWNNSDDLSTCYTGYMTQGNFKRCPSGTSSPYDGLATIDGTSIHMDNGSTAALYDYTPHKSGNAHFDTIFASWFGSPVYSYAGEVTVTTYSDAARTHPLSLSAHLASGQKIYVTVSALNSGSKSWSSSFARVATLNPTNRSSVFRDSSWLSSNRPAHVQQSSVAPGSTGTFQFSMTTPNTDGEYHEDFGLVAEGQSDGWMRDSATFGFDIVVSNPYNGDITQLSTYRNSGYTQPVDPGEMAYGQKVYVLAKVRNTGTQTWSNSFTKMAATSAGANSFNDGSWPSATRPATVQEASVAPGATGTFKFVLTAPSTAGTYNENFQLVADGQASGWMPGATFNYNILTVAPPVNSLYSGRRIYPGMYLYSKNGKYFLVLQSDGNMVIHSVRRAIWSSNTARRSIQDLVMQGDGNLVLYGTNGTVYWSSHTAGSGPSSLVMQNDGNLVIYNKSGHAKWASNTNGKV